VPRRRSTIRLAVGAHQPECRASEDLDAQDPASDGSWSAEPALRIHQSCRVHANAEHGVEALVRAATSRWASARKLEIGVEVPDHGWRAYQ
jgi:hypothetical protein